MFEVFCVIIVCLLTGNFYFFFSSIPLPQWVVEEVDKDPDLAYTDQWGRRNHEYISLGADTLPVLKGRTPVQCYSDFMRAFRDNFKHLLGDTIVVIPNFSFTHFVLHDFVSEAYTSLTYSVPLLRLLD